MTEKTPAIDPAAPGAAAPGSASPDTAGREPSPPGGATQAEPPRRGRGLSTLALACIIAVLIALALAVALWYQRQQFERTGRDVASRLEAATAEAAAARRDARQALALAQSQGARVRALDEAMGETQSRYSALEQAWQTFNDGSGDVLLLNDIEQMLTLANQQLRLGGSVSNAIVALETAQARLARSERPVFATLQQAINGDLDRLRAVPMVDVTALTGRVEQLIQLTGRAPLLVPDRAVPGVSEPPPAAGELPPAQEAPPLPADASWWQRWRAEMASWPGRAAGAVGREMADMISIQRVDDAHALLLSPEQGAQLRANVRMRLLTAQVALLMRQSTVWQNELDAVASALATSYDTRSPDTAAAQRLVRDLAQARVAVQLPTVSDSLSAAASLRASLGNTPSRSE